MRRANPVAIVAIAGALMAVGSVMTVSAAAANTDRAILGWAFWEYPAVRQLVFVAGGLCAMLVMMAIPYRLWAAGRGFLSKVVLGIAVLACAAVLVPGVGVEVNGARRWLQFGPSSFGLRLQASELVKIAMPIFLACWLTVGTDIRLFWRGFVPAIGALGLGVGIVGIEDFGTAALIMGVGGCLLVVGGARWLHLSMLVVPTILAFGALLFSKSNRIERLLTFMDIWRDPEGSGYQVIQSLCTIANGGWWGAGVGQGFVKGYLPEARNDFIFAVICEELGVIGAVGVIALLIALIWQGRKSSLYCSDPMGRLLALGITLTIGLQAAMNIAVVTVSVPTKGISLPLVSAGGSGAVFLGAFVGILANIARHADREQATPD